MEAPTRFPGPSARRMALPVVGPIANVDEARMLEKIVLLCELRDRLSPLSPRRR